MAKIKVKVTEKLDRFIVESTDYPHVQAVAQTKQEAIDAVKALYAAEQARIAAMVADVAVDVTEEEVDL